MRILNVFDAVREGDFEDFKKFMMVILIKLIVI